MPTPPQLNMLGYDISFAAFKIVEVMSSAKFSHKRVGYVAASMSFNDDTDVLMLTTNMLKKVQKYGYIHTGVEYININMYTYTQVLNI